jgi:spoIIIJ-associated protein
MIREITTEGPSVADAIDAALDEMGVQQDAVEYEVVDEGAEGSLSAAGSVRVRVWIKPGADVAAETEALVDEQESGGDDGPMSGPAVRPDVLELSDEELDAVADAGVETIGELLGRLGITAEVDEYEGDEGEIILDIVGDDLGLLIGRHGRTLDALQVLVSAISNRKLDQRYPIVVDVSGYRHRRRLKLEEIAKRAADRAARQRRAVQMRPMTSFERRVIHVALREDTRVTTVSEGDEPRRMVVVHPRRS